MIYLYGLFRPSLLLELGINNLKEKGFTGKSLLVTSGLLDGDSIIFLFILLENFGAESYNGTECVYEGSHR